MVGRTPWSAAGPLAGLFGGADPLVRSRPPGRLFKSGASVADVRPSGTGAPFPPESQLLE
jgi:hypothetical protein